MTTTINSDVNEKGHPYAPFWKKLITAGRAAEGLRDVLCFETLVKAASPDFEWGGFDENTACWLQGPDGTFTRRNKADDGSPLLDIQAHLIDLHQRRRSLA